MLTTFGGHPIAGEAIAGTWTYGDPTVSVSVATQFDSDPLVVTWSYSSIPGYAQQKYRLWLYNQDQSVTLFNVEETSSAATGDITFAWSSYSTYVVAVQVFDGFNWSNISTAPTTFVGGTQVPDPNPEVGSIYEVAINGTGLMLRDHPDRQPRYQRRIASIEAPRLATGATPFSEGFDRYTMIGQVDWSSGAGQRFRDRERSTYSAFWRSTGVDPFTVGQLRLLNDTERVSSEAHDGQLAVVFGDELLVVTDTGELTAFDGSSDSSFSITSAGDILDVTTDGGSWYVCDGSDIYRNTTAADPTTAWSTVAAEVMEWCGDRLVVAYTGSGSTPNVVSVLADNGTEVGSPQQWTLPEGTTVHSITHGNGYIWWSASRGPASWVYAWKVGTTDSYFTAIDLPQGSVAQGIAYYQGIAYIQTANDNGTTTVLRAAATDEGLLVPAVLVELPVASTAPMSFVGWGDKVLFSWTGMAGGSGVGVIDLASGGYATGYSNPDADNGVVRSVVVWQGRPAFTIDEYGPVAVTGDVLPSGALDGSIADLGTGLRKRFDSLVLTTDPLPADASIGVEMTLDGGLSYTPVGTVATTGLTTATFPIDVSADSIGVRVVLNADSTSPVLRTVSVKAHPVGLADRLLVFPINCGDSVAGLNGAPLRDNGKGAGSRRARWLESLMQQTVYVQDVDWKQTGVVGTYEVAAVDIESVGVFDRAVNRQTQDMIAVVTLRGQA